MSLVGLDESNVAAQYRARAQNIADEEVPRPVRAFVVEFALNGEPTVLTLSMARDSRAELVQNAAHAIDALANVICSLNAKQGN